MSSLKKILVVDDEEGILEAISELLSEYADEVLTSTNVEEGLKLYQENSDDIKLIVSDLSMPKEGGIDFLAEIRAINSNVPFILFTGYGDQSEILLSLKYKAFDFIEKPEFQRLTVAVVEALKTQ